MLTRAMVKPKSGSSIDMAVHHVTQDGDKSVQFLFRAASNVEAGIDGVAAAATRR